MDDDEHPWLNDPEFNYTWEEIECEGKKNLYSLALNSKKIALYVFISSNLVDFIASDNYFSMLPDEIYIINIEVLGYIENSNKYSKQNIIDSFKIQSLFNLR
ncbi:MAG: glycoside hydrolase family 2 protein [Candidatus Thorarchaeota archaeon]